MKLSFGDKENLTKPVSILLNYHDPNNAKSSGSLHFRIEATVEENDGETIHTLNFAVLVDTNYTVTKPQKISIRSLDGKRTVEATASKKMSDIGYKLIGQYKIVLNTTDDTFVVEDVWETTAESAIRVGKNYVLPTSLTYNLSREFKDVVIKSYNDVLFTLISLNEEHSFLNNPTISLLLHLIASDESRYTPVFLEWFEKQFVDQKDKYREAFGNKYLPDYNKLNKRVKANIYCNEVVKEQPNLDNATKQEPTTKAEVKIIDDVTQETTTEPVVDEPKEVTEPVDTPLTHSYALSGHSVPDSDPSDLLFEELASEGFFDEALTNKDDIEYLELPEKHREAFVKIRIGQSYFRDALVDYWGECAITKCKEISLLKASHIKPWSKCDSKEAVDPFNGFLLSPTLDTAFDKGFITFDDTGKVLISAYLKKSDAEILGIFSSLCLSRIEQRHQHYLNYHREHIFQKS